MPVNKNSNFTFGKRLSREMLRLDITQTQLQKTLGLKQAAISNMTLDKTKSIKFSELNKLYELGFDMPYILFNDTRLSPDRVEDKYDEKVRKEMYVLQGKLIACLEDKKELDKQIEFLSNIQSMIEEDGEEQVTALQFKMLEKKLNTVLDGLKALQAQKMQNPK